MPNFLSLTGIGHIGRVDEVKTTPKGVKVLRFSLACSVGFGENKKTQWLDCSMFGDRVSKLSEMMRKGDALCIVGEPEVRQYTKSDGAVAASLSVVVREVVLLERKPQGGTEEQHPAPADDGGTIPF